MIFKDRLILMSSGTTTMISSTFLTVSTSCQPANCRSNTLKIANATHSRIIHRGLARLLKHIFCSFFHPTFLLVFFFTCTLNKYCCCQLNSCYLFVFLNLRSQNIPVIFVLLCTLLCISFVLCWSLCCCLC